MGFRVGAAGYLDMEGTDMEQTTAEAIREYIACNFLFDDTADTLPDDASLLQLGIIDSMGVLSLLMFAEEQFGIDVVDTEVTPDHFDSIARLTAYIDGKRAAQRILA